MEAAGIGGIKSRILNKLFSDDNILLPDKQSHFARANVYGVFSGAPLYINVRENFVNTSSINQSGVSELKQYSVVHGSVYKQVTEPQTILQDETMPVRILHTDIRQSNSVYRSSLRLPFDRH